MKYNHMFDVAFSVVTSNECEDVTADELILALEDRISYLKANPNEIIESCGYCDSYEMED